MKAASAIGIVVAVLGLAIGATMEGTSIAAFLNLPAILIVLGGTFGATVAACGLEPVKRIPTYYRLAFNPPSLELGARAQELVTQSERARKEGLLALEADLDQIADPFTRNGLQLVVDGTEPELVREVLDAEIDGMEHRHHLGSDLFERAGGFAPTMGIIGTVMGLVHVLENLDQPATLGPAISGAFIATLLGVGAANVVLIPIGNRLKSLSKEEVAMRTMVLEGVLAIQAGDNPRIVAEKLLTFVPPGERAAAREAESPSLRLADEPAAAQAA
jgi:chemotaxis protein MotA